MFLEVCFRRIFSVDEEKSMPMKNCNFVFSVCVVEGKTHFEKYGHIIQYQISIIMFSGIIEEAATVVALREESSNLHITMRCSFAHELKIDQSVAHNGVCLTVVEQAGDTYTVTAIKETLDRSNLGLLAVGDKVNVERSMLMNGRLDGHIVQGHVDGTATCVAVEEVGGSSYFTFEYEFDSRMAKRGYFTVDKGSVTVNGVSLTVCAPTKNRFSVAIIPYTLEFTNFHQIGVGTMVNLEFDIIGKYISRLAEFHHPNM